MLQEQYTAQEKSVVDVFNRHFAAFTSGDIEAVLDDFTEESVVVTLDGVFVGLNRIRLVFGALLAEFGNIDRGDSPGFTIDTLRVHGDTLFIAWHAQSQFNTFPFGTDTFVCQGGKITRQTIAFSPPRPTATA